MEFESTTFDRQETGEMKMVAASYESVVLSSDSVAHLGVMRDEATVTIRQRLNYSAHCSFRVTPLLIDSLCEYLQQVKPLLAVHGITDKDTKEDTPCSS